MKSISVKMPFDSTPDKTKKAFNKFVREIHLGYLGHMPMKADATKFKQSSFDLIVFTNA